MWLLVDENEVEFTKKFRIFSTLEICLPAARAIGWEVSTGMGIKSKSGSVNVYSAGDVDLKIININVDEHV